MAESVRPPVAIRIVRPYETEDALLEHELDTVGKTSVILIGAHPRPTGVILRFEVTLASGATVLRGEGRVLAHKENAFRGQAGLTLRFTRLDPRSKAVVDRATAMREARQADGGTPSRPAPRPEGAVAEALTASTPAPGATAPLAPSTASALADQEAAVASARASAREKANAQARANARRTGGTLPPTGKTMALTPPPLPVFDSPAPEDAEAGASEREREREREDVTAVPGEVRESASRRPWPTLDDGSVPTATSPTISAPPLRNSRSAAASSSRRAPAQAVAASASPPAEAAHVSASVPVMAEPPDTPVPAQPIASSRTALVSPPDRDALLARLRERAGTLAPERVQEILASRR